MHSLPQMEPEVQEVRLAAERERYITAGYVPREVIQDNIVKVADFIDDPHEVWRRDPWWDCWVRVEVSG